MSRYHVSSSEGQYEKDSGEQVLANKLGIATSDEMDEAELVLLGVSLDIENYCTIRASPACQRRCLRFLSAL